jgi:hypothetical protein
MIVLGVMAALLPTAAMAATTKDTSLSISPLRQELSVTEGAAASGKVTIGNQTESPITVTMTVKEFAVTDFAYDYVFKQPQDDWVKLPLPQAVLVSHESKSVAYSVNVPKRATPGGHYFAIFASTEIPGEGLPGTAQVVSLLYLTVKGELVRTSVLQNDTVPFLVTGSEVPYKFDVKDTGNIYFTAYFYGQLQGLFGQLPESGTSHLLMPGAVRTVDGAIPAPLWPGIYKFTYGYKVDFASIITTKSSYIVYVPPWSIAALVFLLLAGHWLWQRRHKSSKPTPET